MGGGGGILRRIGEGQVQTIVNIATQGGPFSFEWGQGKYTCHPVNCKQRGMHTVILRLKIWPIVGAGGLIRPVQELP